MNPSDTQPLKPGLVPSGKFSVVAQLTLFVVAMLAVLLGGMLSISYVEGRGVLRDEIENRLSAVAESRRDMVQAHLAEWRQLVALLAANGEYRGLLDELGKGLPATANRGYSQASIDDFVNRGVFLSAVIADLSGHVQIASKDANPEGERAGDPIFQGGLTGPQVGQPRRVGDRFEVEISAPIDNFDQPRKVIGVLLITLDATRLAEALRSTTGLGKTGEVLLGVSEGGQIRFIFPPRGREDTFTVPLADAPTMAAAIEGRERLARNRDYRGQPVLASGRPIGYGGWGLVAKMDEREAYAPIDQARNAVLALAVGVGALGLAGAYLLARGFTRPIRRLARVAESVAAGDLEASVTVRSGNELGALTATFNEMTAALRVRAEEREKAEASLASERSLLRTLIDVLPVSIYVKDAESRFLVANAEAAHSVGAAAPDEVLGKTDADFFPPAIAAAFRENELLVLGGEPVLNLEHKSAYPDGSARTELTSKVPLRDSTGAIVGIVGVSRDVTEHRQAEEAVRASEALLRSITDNTEDIIFVKDRESRTIFKNPAGLRANALPPDQVLGRTDTEFNANPAEVAKFLADDRRVMETGQTLKVEEVLTTSAGEKRSLLTTKTPRYDAEGNIVGLVGIAHDITERKRAEEALRASEQRLRAIIEVEPECVKVVSPEGKLLEMNPAGLAMLDATSLEDLSGQSLLNFVAPEHRSAFAALHKQIMAGHSGTLEFETIGLKGTRRWVETHAVPLRDAAGHVTSLVGVTRDITERKRAEEALRASEQRFRSLMEKGSGLITLVDATGTIIYESPNLTRVLGYARGELLGQPMFSIAHPDDIEVLQARLQEVLAEPGVPNQVQNRVRDRDGAWRWLETVATNLLHDPTVRAIVLNSRDITARKGAEAALVAERTRLRTLLDLLPVSIYVKDRESRFIVANEECARAVAATMPEELIGKNDADFFPPALAAAFLQDEQRVLAGESILNLEEESAYPDGRPRTELTTKVPLRDATGAIIGLVGVSRDITERRQAEEALRASEALLRSITDNTEDMIFVKDRESRTIFMNPVGFRANAVPPEKLIGHSDAEFIEDPAEAAHFLADDRRVMESRQTQTVEEELTSATGEKRILLTTKTPRLDAEGNVIGLVGVARDITALRAADAALRGHAERLALLAEATGALLSSEDPVAFLDGLFDRLATVLRVELYFHYSVSADGTHLELAGARGITDEQRADLHRLEFGEAVCGRIAQTRAPDLVADVQSSTEPHTELIRSLGITAYACQPLLAQGKLLGTLSFGTRNGTQFSEEALSLLGAVTDHVAIAIARQRASTALRESEQQLRNLGDNIPGGTIYQLLVPPDGPARYVYMSAGIERLLGIPTELVLSDPASFWRLIVEEDRPTIATAQEHSARTLSLFDCEFRQRTGRGEIKWLHARATPRRLEDGSFLWDGVVTDVTERKHAEAALRESEERYELAVVGAAAGIWDWDVTTGRVYYSPRWMEMRGYTPAEISDRAEEWNSRIHPDDAPRVLAALRAHVQGETPVFSEEYRTRCKDGSWKWVHDRGIALRDATGRAIRMAGSETDITERREAQMALRESEERYARAIRGTSDGLWDWNILTGEDYLSPRWKEMLGFTDDELRNHEDTFFSRIHPDDLPRVRAAVDAHLEHGDPYDIELRLRSKSGDYSWFRARGEAERNEQGRPVRMAGSISDITERKRAEAALRESEERFRAFMDLSPIVAWIKDDQFQIRYVNAPFGRLFQSTPEKLIGQTDYDYLPPDAAAQTRANDQAVLATGRMIETIEHVPGADNRMRHWLVQKFPLVRSAQATWVGGTAVDLTERVEAEESIKASLHEKEVLLREVHHRVKNNLQIVSSLLNLQSRQLTDPTLLDVFASTRDRVRAMAAVHERLYESGDFARIDLAAHLSSLARALTRAHSPAGVRVQFVPQLDPVPVDLNTAVPLSLIANELILNALKYAFTGRTEGTLTIELHPGAERNELRVADDGPGFPSTLDPTTTRTLGLRLVRDLSRQIAGELEIDSKPSGTNIAVRWPAAPTVNNRTAPADDAGAPTI